MKFSPFILIIILLSSVLTGRGQGTFFSRMLNVPYDSNYISTYTTDYTSRIYGSVKYGNMGYNDNLIGQSLAYRPNNKLLLGVGVNHGFLGINIGINFPFINQMNGRKRAQAPYLLEEACFITPISGILPSFPH